MKHDEVAKLWDKNAKTWQEASEQGFDLWRDFLNTPAFLKMLPDVSDLFGLDVGCGEGHNSRLIAQRCKLLTAIDISDEFLKINQNATNNPPNISYRKANAEAVPFPNGYFDFVTATMSFMDTADLEKVLTEINRVLSGDGFLQFSIVHPCFNEHNGQWVKDKQGNNISFLMKDYFRETTGDIQVWQHQRSPSNMPKFHTPRFWRPLNKWLTILARAGFNIEEVTEPYADDETIKKYPELASTRVVAHSLIIRARKNQYDRNVLRKIIENLPGNAWWKDKNLLYLGCNDQVIKVLGLSSRKDFIGKTDHELWEKSIADKLEEADRYVLKTGETINVEETIVENNGRQAIMLTNKSPFYDESGNIIGIVGTSTDITERKKIEQALIEAKEHAETSDKAKTEFLMNMRHDIRTPLSGIIGFAGLIKEEVKNGSVAEYADNMLASGQALLDFLNEVLEAIRVTSGEIPLLRKKFDLKEKIESIITLNQSKAKQKQLKLLLDYDPQIPKYLLGDSKRAHRIVLELVSNALNFTHQGEVKITVSLAKHTDHEVILKIIVSDTGVGIPKDKLEDIFIRFKRLIPSYEGIYKGVGIGLTVVKQFIDDLDGEIYVESEIEKGSIFTCVFRFKEALLDDEQGVDHTIEKTSFYSSSTAVASTELLQNMDTSPSNIHILIVEDSPIAALVANKLLSHLGCHVDVAANGQSALEQAKMKKYDAIFMDVGLPDISGNETTQAFRIWEANTTEDKRTPIIALTAHVETEEKQTCIASGMDAVLSKPLTREKAIDILSAFVPKYGAQVKKEPSEIQSAADDIRVLTGQYLDREEAIRLAGNEELAKELLDLLIQQLPIERESLIKAHKESNWTEIQAIVHKLKGSATYCGAGRLKQASGYLSDHLKMKKTDLRESLYEQVLQEINLLEKEIVRL